MNYNWVYSSKMQGEICSPVDAHGYRFMLCVNPSGNYSVIKFLVRNSSNLPFAAARPHQIASGWCESTDAAKEHAIRAFERFVGILKAEPVVEEVKAEEPVKEPVQEDLPAEVEAVAEETEIEQPVAVLPSDVETEDPNTKAFTILSEPAEDGQIKVWLAGLKENCKYKYTTNGKAVVSNSKNYKEPFFVAPGTVINARETWINEELQEEVHLSISKTV